MSLWGKMGKRVTAFRKKHSMETAFLKIDWQCFHCLAILLLKIMYYNL